jgi:energy-converting hydrogenase Eha subunit H
MATTVLKITTIAPTQTASVRSRPTFWYALWLPICGLALLGAGSSRRRRWVSGAALVVLLGTIAWLPACGSKASTSTTTGTQPGTYSIVITSTSGSYSYPPTTSPRPISLTVTSN